MDNRKGTEEVQSKMHENMCIELYFFLSEKFIKTKATKLEHKLYPDLATWKETSIMIFCKMLKKIKIEQILV